MMSVKIAECLDVRYLALWFVAGYLIIETFWWAVLKLIAWATGDD